MTTEPQTAIHYLTVQDILWINHEVTREVLPYKFAQLEEATFGQYAYGESKDVKRQAGAFLAAFNRLRPFTRSNRATSFIAVLAFLQINGVTVDLTPERALPWIEKASGRTIDAQAAIQEITGDSGPQPMDLKPAVRTTVREILKAYASVVESLGSD